MNKFLHPFVAVLLFGGAAQAQEANEATGPDAPGIGPAEPAAPAAEAGSPAAATISEAEIDSFAKATIKLQAIQADTSIADDQKQTRMHEAVAESGLNPEQYNAIGKAAQADPELRAKVQTAMAKHTNPAG